MFGAAILALLGMGVLASSLMLGFEDDETDSQSPEEDADIERMSEGFVHHLSAFDAVSGTEGGDIFAAEHARGTSQTVSVINGFDPTQDIVAFDLDELSSACFDETNGAAFSPDADLSYDVTTTHETDTGSTRITLSLFDQSDPDTDPVYYDVLLRGVPEISDANISVVVGRVNLSQATGGERADILTGSDAADTVEISGSTDLARTSDGDDVITGTGEETLLLAGAGNDTVSVSGVDLQVYGGSGDDVIDVTSNAPALEADNTAVFGGDGNDTITIGLGTDVVAGTGVDDITLNVTDAPENGQPLFLWNQPVEDARFSGHSIISLNDNSDTIRLNLASEIGGHLHQVRLTQESFGTSSQEVFTKEFTLILWTPEGVTDISDLVAGPNSVFNGTLAQDSVAGDADYEAAATDPLTPRVILTIENGTAYSGDFDDLSGSSSGGFNDIFEPDLIINREITSVHAAELF